MIIPKFGTVSKMLTFINSCFCCLMFVVNICATETIIYSEGFESDDGGFIHTGVRDSWEWGVPSPSFTLGPDMAHSGNKCWGTNLDDTVEYNSNANLTSPPITLPSLTGDEVIRVRFFGWISVDFMSDRGQFQVSKDGINWETKADLLLTMAGGWNEYVFNITDYAGDDIYLRFRCISDNINNFDPPFIPKNMSGLYVDDIAIISTEAPPIKKILTFEGSENQSSIASCPWIYTKGENGKFKKDNDIYSTARGHEKEYTDFYMLNHNPVATDNGKYVIKLIETEMEESYTDFLSLIVVDHPANTRIISDEHGNVFTYKNIKNPKRPLSALDNNGENVISMINEPDEIGYKVFNGDYIDLDFSSINNANHPIFILRAQGFLYDTSPGDLIPGIQPKIKIQTQEINGQWVTRNVFYPRWKFASSGYDMANYFPLTKKIRLLATSCHTGKYHLIDWAVISTKPQKPITVTELTPKSAKRSDGANVVEALSAIDENYVHMSTGENVKIKYDEPVLAEGDIRDFIIKSRGYYIPNGTYFFFTWDGTSWVQRDGWSIPFTGDQTREFDLSLWLPDPDGEYKVRIWQDFFFDPAAIDFVGLSEDNVDLTMESATDLIDGSSILNLLNNSDNIRHAWDWGENWGVRDRWVEIKWTDGIINTPPSTNPVYVTNTNSPTPTINWTYFDLDGDLQTEYEIEVWGGPNGTGTNMWDPPVGSGSSLSETYAGITLVNSIKYYARVKAFDGTSWGTWSESEFEIGSPPTADAGPDISIIATPSCFTSVILDGSGSYDPDGDELSYLWTGPFGTEVGPKPAVFFSSGTFLVKLIVSDGHGGSGMDSVWITVQDTAAPIPDSTSLPDIIDECSVIITEPPTATDSCSGEIVGTTDILEFSTPGSHEIIWSYDDGNGNISTQTQIITVTDNLAPVPDVPTLPTLNGDCFVSVTNAPTATDNCEGTIAGTTTDPISYSETGTYTITWEYKDANGNSATQTQTVVINDVTAPTPDLATLPTISGSCEVEVDQTPTATDACAGQVVGTTDDSLHYSTAGTYTITWNYNDGNGNVSSQEQTVIVVDTTPPVPDLDTLPVIRGDCKVKMVCQSPTATDECKGIIIGSTSDPLKYRKQGVYTITWTFDDGNGNISTQLQIVIVDDVVPPVPKVDPLPTIRADCKVTVTTKPVAKDNCNGKIIGKTSDPLTYKKQGTYTIHWKYTDKNGNTTTQTQTVIVDDNVAPVPRIDPLPVIQGDCKVIVCKKPTAIDNCKGQIVGKTSDPLSYSKQGTYTIRWKYKDGNGNISKQTQTVIVQDNVAPIPKVAHLPDIYGRLKSYGSKDKRCCSTCKKKFEVKCFPYAIDNCKGKIVATTTSPLIFYKKGDYTIVWKYDDGNGNISTQNQTVHVR